MDEVATDENKKGLTHIINRVAPLKGTEEELKAFFLTYDERVRTKYQVSFDFLNLEDTMVNLLFLQLWKDLLREGGHDPKEKLGKHLRALTGKRARMDVGNSSDSEDSGSHNSSEDLSQPMLLPVTPPAAKRKKQTPTGTPTGTPTNTP